MATYQFRCDDDGAFDVVTGMGEAGPRRACPACGRDSPRSYSAPMLNVADRRVVAALDRADRTREQPDVVTTLPDSTRSPQARRAPPNPAFRRLPRP